MNSPPKRKVKKEKKKKRMYVLCIICAINIEGLVPVHS